MTPSPAVSGLTPEERPGIQRGIPGLGVGGHQRPHRGATDVWLTPPDIIEALGPFDLDPCAAIDQPWRTATTQFTEEDDGLAQPWHGFCWVNPPYGPETGKWLSALADHDNGIALIFARTETADFFAQVWERAYALLFLRGRLHFHRADGTRAKSNSGAPSVLIAYGQEAAWALRSSGLPGQFVPLRPWPPLPSRPTIAGPTEEP